MQYAHNDEHPRAIPFTAQGPYSDEDVLLQATAHGSYSRSKESIQLRYPNI